MPKCGKNTGNELSLKSTIFPKAFLLIMFAVVLRYLLMSSKYQNIIANHVEISTPLNSWKRVLEGTFLLSRNNNPYDGDLLHETPIAIIFYKTMLEYVFKNVNAMFIAFDISTGIILCLTSARYATGLQQTLTNKKQFPRDVIQHLPSENFSQKVTLYVLMTFLFNPYTVLGCVGYSTMSIHNFFLSLFILGMLNGNIITSSLALTICTTISFYPFIIIVPLVIYFIKVHNSKSKALLALGSFLFSLILIIFFNYNFSKSLNNVYGCILTVPDLQPNIGLFWYFFTEMFDHFRELFIYSFQINTSILYLIPLSIRFRNQPFILTVALLFLIAIFKSYPCLSDLGFVLTLLPNFLHLLFYCQQGFVVGVMLLMTSCLAPVLWYLWIYTASANANFYFGVTLGYAIAEIFLLTDILFAQTKWEFLLKHGKETKIDNEDGVLSLE